MGLWEDASKDLQRFNSLYAQVERKPHDVAVLRKCVSGANKLVSLAVWANKSVTSKEAGLLLAARREVAKVAKSPGALEGELRGVLEGFISAVEAVLGSTAPGVFTYEGLRVVNEERISDELCREVLSGIDYLRALFKKRGVSAGLLREAISRVDLVLHGDVGAANFNSSNLVLTLSVPELTKHAGRFLDTSSGEAVLHEFGHYIHINYIKGEAARVWDQPWEGLADLADPRNQGERGNPDRAKRLEDLEVVTEYGKTNEKEDFAETFLVFMAAPERLTPTSKFRMQRALSLSGLYGKPVMRLSSSLALGVSDLLDSSAERVLARHKIAAEKLYNSAVANLATFNKQYEAAQRVDISTPRGQKLLNDFAFRKDGTAPSFPGNPFHDWMSKAFGMEIDDPDAKRPKGVLVLGVADGKIPLQDFLDGLDEYADALRGVLHAAGPERFEYQGFKITNLDRLGDYKTRKLLEGVDYLVALFKKRGLDPLLEKGVSQVNLAMDLGGSTLGLYMNVNQQITLSAKLIDLGEGRFMKWVNEAFLHEFGHYVHMHYLSKEAAAAWDEGWAETNDKKKLYAEAFKTVTKTEREKFFHVLQGSDMDPAKAAKKLTPVEKVKLGVWLRSPMTGIPLITDKQFRWTKDGQRVAAYFKDPEKFIADNYNLSPNEEGYLNQSARTDRQMRDKIGLLYDGPFSISPSVVEELSKSDPSMQKTIDEALDKLEIVSDYGKTNEKEDFAETFVAFVGAPEKLTATSKFRMQRALSLSGLYGKPVMRLSSSDQGLSLRVASLWLSRRFI